MRTKALCISFFFLSLLSTIAQVQCVVDVTITEGNSISFCSDNPTTINASNGFVAYSWTGPQTGSNQSITPQSSGQYVVAATDGVGCVSTDTIDVTINANPADVILSTEGNPLCPNSAGTILSLQNSYVSYDWGGGITTPSYFVTEPGTYSVIVVDINGCAGNSAITLTELDFSLTANQNGFCGDGSVGLIANGGTSYLWSTGETGSSIVVSPSIATQYWVEISSGNCIDTLYEFVEAVSALEFDLVDTIFVASGESTTIEGPDGFSSYLWSPSTNIDNPLAPIATYHGNQSEYITLTADYFGLCTYVDSVYMFIVTLTIPEGFSPNGDSKNEFFVIPELSVLDGSLKVWNRWGDPVFENENYENNWRGTCETSLCLGKKGLPEGVYFYLLDVQGIVRKGQLFLKR